MFNSLVDVRMCRGNWMNQKTLIKDHVCIFMCGIIFTFLLHNSFISAAGILISYGTANTAQQNGVDQKNQVPSQSPTCLETWNHFRKNYCCNTKCIKECCLEDCCENDHCCFIKHLCGCLGFVLLGLFCPCCITSR